MGKVRALWLCMCVFLGACGPKHDVPTLIAEPGLSAAARAELWMAERAMAEGNGAEAVAAYRRALLHAPTDGALMVRLGHAQILAGVPDAALDGWQRVALTGGRGEAAAWLALAEVALAVELWEEARLALQQADEAGGGWAVDAALVWIFSKEEEQDLARTRLEAWLARPVTTLEERKARGQAAAMLGVCGPGLADLGVVLGVHPTDADAIDAVLHCARAWQSVGSALNLLERTLALSPDAAQVRDALLALTLETGDPYRAAAACVGSTVCAAHHQARIAEMMHGLSRRTVTLDSGMDMADVLIALEKDPTDAGAWGRRGQIMWQNGDVQLAFAHFSTAVRYAPAHTELREWLQRAGTSEAR